MIIAQYTTDAIGVRPRFNPECAYTANEIDNGNGTYTVTLTADNDFTYVDFNDSNNLLSVEYLKVTNKVTHLQKTFNGCELLTSINASDWDTSNVEDMDSTFCFCYSLNTITGIENWNTNSLTALYYTFCDCRALTSLNLSNWNTSNVTATERIFFDCASLTELDIRNWDLSNADSSIESMITYFEFEPKLKVIKCNDPETILGMVPTLPDRRSEEAGIIITDNTSEINTEELVDLNWKVAGLIAKYKYYKPTLDIDMDSIMYQIPEPTTFDGSGYIDTGIQLLKNDSDWTLFLDCTPNINNKSQAIIHCVDESGSYPGISLSLENGGNIGLYNGTNGTVLGNGRYLNKKIKIAIVKKDNNIIVYHNNSSSIQYQKNYPITIPYTFKSANTTLSIGGGHRGTSAINTFSGVINNFVIYNKALEEQECESIISDNPLPIFNNNFNYTIEDKYLDTDDEEIVTRSIYAATDFTSCRFEGESGLATVEYLKVTNKVTTMDQMFYNCYNMTSVNANGWNTRNVTSMVETFSYCCSLEEITGIENWVTNSLKNLACTFNCCCESLTSLNLSGWDTSKVTNMYGTFGYCCSLEEIIGIENWDTSSVTDLSSIFECCEWLTSLDLSKWDTNNVTSMFEAFSWCCRLEEIIGIENWDTSSVEDLTYTFACCESLTSLNLSSWDTSNVICTDETFSDCTHLEELDISNWDLSNADPDWLANMFYISELDSDSTDWYDPDFKPYLKTIKCNNANTISLIAPYLQDRSTCEESGVITTTATGIDTSILASKNWEIDIISILVAKYTFDKTVEENLIPVFNNGFNYIIEDEYLNAENENIVTRNIYSNTDFTSCSFIEYINGKAQYHPSLLTVEYLKITNKVTSLFELFRGCSNLTKVDTTGWDTSNVTNMKNTFYSCAKLETNLNNLNTSKVTNMNGIFSYANTDAVQGVEDLDVSKVTDFGFAFYGSHSTELDLSKWDMSSATSLYVMFTTANKLKSLKVNTWNTSNVTSMNSTFWYTDGLKKLDVSGWTSDKCTIMEDLFGHMWALEELDLGNFKIIDNINSSGRFFLDDVNLKIIHTSNLETIIKLPELLPDRTGKNKGEIRTDIPKGELAQEILAAYSAKNWKIVNGTLVAKYTFNNAVNENLIPMLNTSFTNYVIEDEYLDTENENIITRYIYSIAHEDFSSCKFTNKTGLLSVDYLKITNKVTDLNSLFDGCTSLTRVNTDGWDTSNVTGLGYLCRNCNSLIEFDVGNFNTSKLNSIYEAFSKCTSLAQLDVSSWDTSRVVSLYNVFNGCSSLTELDVSEWSTENVEEMSLLFKGCSSLTELDVSGWNTGKVTAMQETFLGCKNLTNLDLNNWNVENLQFLMDTFSGCTSLAELKISDWNTKSVTNMSGMFYLCKSLKSLNINNWNVDSVKNIGHAFRYAGITAINLDNWNVGNVTNMDFLFEASMASEINISNWKFNPNVSTTQMLQSIHTKEIIINNSNVFTVNTIINSLPSTYRTEKDPGVLDIRGIDNRLQVDIELAESKHWNVELEPLVAKYTFDKSIDENLIPVFNDDFDPIIEDAYLDEGNENIVTRYIYSATEEDFSKCSFCNKTGLLSIEYLKATDKVTSMNQMFFNCSNLTSINVDNWDTSQVQNLEYAFSGCSKLTELDISDWDVDEVSNTNCMFEDCSLLTTIGDVSSWNTGKVTIMQGMFRGCSSLTELNLKNWDTSAVTNTSEMFKECSSLRKIICDNSVTINKIVDGLPIRSENDPGKINTICKESDINIEELSNKYWLYEIREYVAKYTCNASGILPTFNNGYEYKVSEIDNGDGTYTVIIFAEEDFTSCKFSNQTSLLTVEYLKVTNKVTTMDNMFYNCRNVYKINARNWDTSNVTNLNSVLGNCSKLVEIDLSDWDTGKVTTMHSAFREIKTLQGYENLDVSKVTEFSFLFYGSPITELDLSKWDMSSAKSLYVMFTICSQLKSLKVNTWNTSNVTSMNGTFLYVDKLKKLDVSGWTSDKCTGMSELFKGMWALEELDLGYFKIIDNSTELLTNNPNLKKVFTSNAETIMLLSNRLPSREGKAKGEIVTNVSKSILDEDMLANFSAKNWVLVPGELVAKYTFDKSVEENLIPVFNDNFNYAIEDEYLNAENESIVTRSIYSITREDFTSCSFNNKTGLLSIDYLKITDKVTDMRSMFSNCNNLASIDTNNWDTSKVIDMSSMFYNCSSLTELNVNNLNTDLVQNLAYAFSGCLLTKLNISNWNVGNVINMSYMFKNCSLLTTIGDVNDWETNKVTNMQGMFCGCSSLTELSLRNWDTSAVTNTSEMFKECTNLRKVICDNSETINKIIDGLPIRSENDPGEISTTCRESDINIEGLSNKYWLYKLRGLVAKYTCNVSGILPTFNNGYTYNKVDEIDNGDGTYTVTILADTDFTSCNFYNRTELLSVEYLKVTNKVTSLSALFHNCSSLTKVNTVDWNTSSVTAMNAICWNCSKLTEIDVSNWNTSNVTTLHLAFCNCSSLLELNTSKWNLNKVTTLMHAFQGCFRLTEIDVSNWGTNSLENTFATFFQCDNLTTIKGINNLNMSKVTEIGKMFNDCRSLTELNLGHWVLKEDVRFSEGSFNNTHLLSKIILNKDILLKIGELLPSRVGKEQGLIVCRHMVTGIDTSSIEAKNWMVEFGIVIAKYTSKSIGLRPTFNNGYNYIVAKEDLVDNVYEIELKSEEYFASCSFNGKADLLTVDYLNVTSKVSNMNAMFTNCSNLIEIDVSNWDVSNVLYMYNVFSNCSSLTAINGLGNWKTDKLRSVHFMFNTCRSLTELNVDNWNMSNVNDINNVFANCNNLTSLDLSNWKISNIANMSYMFANCWALTTIGDISNWDTSKVTTMLCLFQDCSSLTSLDVSKWDTGKVTNMDGTFRYCKSLTSLDVSKWDTGNVANMYCMFHKCQSLTSLDVSKWDTGNVKNMYTLFGDCSKLTTIGDVSNWDTGNVTNISQMFQNCESLTSLDVSNWDTSNVTDMYCMFQNCKSLTTLDISKWDTGNVTTTERMFCDCSKLTTIGDVSNWNTGNITNIQSMFNGCQSLTSLDVSNWDTGKVTNMIQVFYDCKLLTTLDVSKWDTSNVKNSYYMFQNCKSLTTIGDVSNWDTGKITNMTQMFKNCRALTSLNLSKWNTINVTNMSDLFYGCESLITIGNISNWDTGNVTNVKNMFRDCLSITKLDLRNWDVRKVTSLEYFIQNCPKLIEINVSNWDTSNISNMNIAFNSLTSLKTLNLSNFNMSNVTNALYMFNHTKFEELNISGWKFNKNIDTTCLLENTSELKSIILKNSNAFTVNKIIDRVVTRSSKDPGVIIVSGIDDISKVNMNSAKAKYWNVCLVKPGPRELESMIFNDKTSCGNKINSKYRNGHIIKIIYNK